MKFTGANSFQSRDVATLPPWRHYDYRADISRLSVLSNEAKKRVRESLVQMETAQAQ